MALQKIKIFIGTLIFLTTFSQAFGNDIHNFRPECYKYYGKIAGGELESGKSYKIKTNIHIDHIIQNGKFVDFKLLKNSHTGLKDVSYKEFSFLNDQNKKTYIQIDTREKKEFSLELEESTSSGSFHFIMDIDSKFHNPQLSISSDGINFTPVSVFNIEDFSFSFLKIEFISKKNIEEIIKVRELSFKEINKTYAIKSTGDAYLEFYSHYLCEGKDTLKKAKNKISYGIDIHTPKLTLKLNKNPKLNTFIGVDVDNDWQDDSYDNCLGIYNPLQEDENADGVGDACSDNDQDGILGYLDNCPNIKNPDQKDVNNNKVGDVCEFDKDGDNIPDALDNCINQKNSDQKDDDIDNIGNICDNCYAYNPGQRDQNENGIGDVCEKIEENIEKNDRDSDKIVNSEDNCIKTFNPDQKDSDKDGVGDVCDNCIAIQNLRQNDLNANKVGDMCEDIDKDGFLGYRDNCMYLSNSDQKDSDNDDIGDICEDDDNDGILYLDDNCPFHYNTRQKDKDNDGKGDICDETDDRFLETNKNFFIFILSIIATIFFIAIYQTIQKINTPNS